MNTDLHFSSDNSEWETPPELFALLDREFHFERDVCATPKNAKCAKYFTVDDDALRLPWTGTCWMNPPYGRQIGKWVAKAFNSGTYGDATVVCLLPARPDTIWWHDYASFGEVRFLRGRLKFVGAASAAPFPSAIVVFRGDIRPYAITKYWDWRSEL